MLKLSIIVPVYNVSRYLRKCVESLLAQNLMPGEYQIILVDDGSTDDCGLVADEYASAFAHVMVIHQPNAGLSAARNAGMDAAAGEYVMFVDSDDYLEPDKVGMLLGKVYEENLDVLRFNYRNVDENGSAFCPYKDVKPFVDYRDEPCDGLTFLNERLGMACYAVQFLVRRSLIDGCRFAEGMYFEDAEWTPRMLVKADRVTSTDTVVYNYLLRDGSITRTADGPARRKIMEDKFRLIQSLRSQSETVTDSRWFYGMTAHTVKQILEDVSSAFYSERRCILRRISSLDVYPLSLYHSTDRVRRKLQMINLSPSAFCFLLKVKHLILN